MLRLRHGSVDSALLGNYDRPTDQPPNQSTIQTTDVHESSYGEVSHPITDYNLVTFGLFQNKCLFPEFLETMENHFFEHLVCMFMINMFLHTYVQTQECSKIFKLNMIVSE